MPETLEENISPETIEDTPPDTLDRRDYSQKEREAMDDSDFGDPENESFPIKTAQDVINAASRLHNAKGDQEAIKARIKRIAKRKGFPLPQTWQDEDKQDDTPTKERSVSGNHPPFTGKHSHAHTADGSQGGDETHEHEHSHDNDADHSSHSHADDTSADRALEAQDIRIDLNGKPLERSVGTPAAAETPKTEPSKEEVPAAVTPESLMVYLPITRYDATSRTVTGQATVEKPDAYGTIFGYYPEAWLQWRGNMREQHDPKKAVGKAIEVVPDEQERAIYVTSKVSRGAQDTWLKIEDGVLSGYSASIIPDAEFGNDPRRWPRKEYEGKQYPYLPRYTVAETSYVDNPATPGCNISLVRADGFMTEVLDNAAEEEAPVPTEPEQKQERSGARVSSDTQSKMHDSIKHTLHAAVSQMANCGCDNCQSAQKAIDPDGDGDIDLGGYDDPDGDADQLYSRQQPQGLNLEEYATKIQEQIDRALQPVYTRLQGIAGTLARSNATPSIAPLESIITSAISRAVESLDAKFAELPTRASLDEVRTELSVVKGQVDRIADTPVPGAPISNTHAIEKRLPTDPRAMNAPQQQAEYPQLYDAFAQLSQAGAFPDLNSQINAAAAVLQRQPQTRR